MKTQLASRLSVHFTMGKLKNLETNPKSEKGGLGGVVVRVLASNL